MTADEAKTPPTPRVPRVFLSPAVRGSMMFVVGLGLTVREALVSGPERPSLYILYAGMMGFPFVQQSFGKSKDPKE